jgi:hypothetical protein
LFPQKPQQPFFLISVGDIEKESEKLPVLYSNSFYKAPLLIRSDSRLGIKKVFKISFKENQRFKSGEFIRLRTLIGSLTLIGSVFFSVVIMSYTGASYFGDKPIFLELLAFLSAMMFIASNTLLNLYIEDKRIKKDIIERLVVFILLFYFFIRIISSFGTSTDLEPFYIDFPYFLDSLIGLIVISFIFTVVTDLIVELAYINFQIQIRIRKREFNISIHL